MLKMPHCTKCKKELDDEQMRECCNGIYYCSRKCEHADYVNHEKFCSKPVVVKEPARPLAEPALIKDIYDPFNRLKKGDYLHGRPDTDVYMILIDAYRLRLHDNYAFHNVRPEDRIDFTSKDGVADFRRFLCQAKAIPRMMPSWWDKKKQAECVELGCQTGWSSLTTTISDSDVCKHYNPLKLYTARKRFTDVARKYYDDVAREHHYDIYMDVQLRLLAEAIYGSGIGGAKTQSLREEMVEFSAEELTKVTKTGDLLREALFQQQSAVISEELREGIVCVLFDVEII
ncbi:hypothetical protein F4782DRAFT_533553 [Xylaria castorea]|nr:hypothetical protein F4782DRAFT_533553 [Xylaria castorea]